MTDRAYLEQRQQALLAVHEAVKEQLMRIPGVVGVGIGLKETGDKLTQEIAFRVYVVEKKDRASLSADELIPDEIMGFKTDVVIVPESTISVFVERRDRADYRPIRGGISINFEDKGGSYGTLGWFGTLNSNPATRVLLTNKHVAFDGSTGTVTTARKAGQANYKKVCCCTCGEIGSVIVAIMDTNVDCAIVRLNSDVNPSLVISNDTATQEITVDGTAVAVVGETVRKVGARSAFTTGVVVDIAATTNTRGTTDAGDTVTITRTNEILIQAAPAETYRIENDKPAFSNSGDSGSVVVNASGQIVGLLYGGSNPTSATINAFVSHIASVLSALSSAGQAITLSNSPGGGGSGFDSGRQAAAHTGLTGTRLDEVLERALGHDPADEPLVQAARVHFDEMLELINHCRPVTVTWHRKQGPAFLGAFMRSVKEPAYVIPQEIEGVNRQHALSAMAVVLEEHGSPALRAAIQAYGLAVINACARYDTVDAIIENLQATIPDRDTAVAL